MAEEILKPYGIASEVPKEITSEIIEEKAGEILNLLTSENIKQEDAEEFSKILKTEGLNNALTLLNTLFKSLYDTKAEREQHREALKENIKKLLAGESIEVGEIMKPTTVEKSQVEPSAVATEKEKKEVPEEKKRKIEFKKGSLTEQFNELYEKFQSYKEQFDEYQKAGLIKPKTELERNIKKLEKILHDTRASKITSELLTQAQGLFEMVEIEFIRQQKQLELKKEREQKITTLHSKIDEFNKQFAEFKKYLPDDVKLIEDQVGELNKNFEKINQAEDLDKELELIDQKLSELEEVLAKLQPKLDEKKYAKDKEEIARNEKLKEVNLKENELINFQKVLELSAKNYLEKDADDPRGKEILQLINGIVIFHEILKQKKQTELESIDPERIAEFLKAKQEKFAALQEAEKFLAEQAQSRKSVQTLSGKLAYNALGTIFAFKAPVDWLLYGLRKVGIKLYGLRKVGIKQAAYGDAYQFMRRKGIEKDVDAFREGFKAAYKEAADSKAWQKKRYEEISYWRKKLAEEGFPPSDRESVESYIKRNETELRLYGRIRELEAKIRKSKNPEEKQGLEQEKDSAEKELTEILAKSNEFLPVDKQEKIPQKRGLTEESYKALKQEVDNLRQRLESSDLPPSAKKQLQKELNKIINANSQAQEKIESSYFEKKNQLFDSYLGQKVHGSQITRDLLNTGAYLAGGPVTRGLVMLFTSPKMVWDSVSYSLKVISGEDPDLKKRLKEYLWDSTARAYKQKGIMPKVFATAGLAVKGGVIYAIYNMAKRGLPTFGAGTFSPEQIGERAQALFTFEGPRKIISNFISGVEGRLGGGAGVGGIEKPEVNFPEEFSRLHATKSGEGIWSVPIKGEQGGIINILIQDRNNDGIPEAFSIDGGASFIKVTSPEQLRQLYNDLQSPELPAVTDTTRVGGGAKPGAEIPVGAKGEAPAPATHFENVIRSAELGPGHHDSIWYSTYQMVKEHAKDLGYKGDPNNTQEFNHWAEVQTNHLVNDLTTRMGGKITDLVHDQDVITMDKGTGDQWQINLEAESGIKPGYLPEVPEAEKIDLEKLRIEEITEPQLRTGYGYKIQELINQRDNELNRLDAAYREGLITDDQLASDQYQVTQQYEAQIDLYKSLSEAAATKGTAAGTVPGIEQQIAEAKEFAERMHRPGGIHRLDHWPTDKEHELGQPIPKTPLPVEHLEPTVVSQDYQQAQELLTKIDSTHHGDYQSILGTPDAPNLEMIKFLNNHHGITFQEIEHLDLGVDLIKTKLDTQLNPETVYQLQQNGYRIETMQHTEGIFDIEKTIILQKGNEPGIFIDEHGNYGSRFEDELVKIGTIEKYKINATFIDDLAERIAKHLR